MMPPRRVQELFAIDPEGPVRAVRLKVPVRHPGLDPAAVWGALDPAVTVDALPVARPMKEARP